MIGWSLSIGPFLSNTKKNTTSIFHFLFSFSNQLMIRPWVICLISLHLSLHSVLHWAHSGSSKIRILDTVSGTNVRSTTALLKNKQTTISWMISILPVKFLIEVNQHNITREIRVDLVDDAFYSFLCLFLLLTWHCVRN